MTYAIAFCGIAGTYITAYALFGARFVYPRWKRWAIGLAGLALALPLWVVHPDISGAPQDGSSLSDQWP